MKFHIYLYCVCQASWIYDYLRITISKNYIKVNEAQKNYFTY